MRRSLLSTLILILPLAANAGEPDACKGLRAKLIPQVAILCDYARTSEAISVRSAARMKGAPMPTERIFQLPAYGSDQSKDSGLACIDGVAMQRIRGGWKQLVTDRHEWVRCSS